MTAVRQSSVLALLWFLPLAADDRNVQKIQERFMAPCCWQESVAIHRSEIAGEMRAEIARMVAGGRSEDQIVDFYVARYGERILREPRGSKRWWLTLVPLASIALATSGLVFFLRRQQNQPALAEDAADLPPCRMLTLTKRSGRRSM